MNALRPSADRTAITIPNARIGAKRTAVPWSDDKATKLNEPKVPTPPKKKAPKPHQYSSDRRSASPRPSRIPATHRLQPASNARRAVIHFSFLGMVKLR